mgnify:FL=1
MCSVRGRTQTRPHPNSAVVFWMWFAGCTRFRAVYVFDMNHPVVTDGKYFAHLMADKAVLLENGNVRAMCFPSWCEGHIVVASPKAGTGDLSRRFHGFYANTMEGAVLKLNESLISIDVTDEQ